MAVDIEGLMAKNIDGRVALVTGAARGLGLSIAKRLAAAGASGLAVDTRTDIHELPAGWLSRQGDVSDESDMADAIETLRARFGRLDIVVANAGLVPPWRETEGISLAEWDQVFAVNVRGVIATIKTAVPLMKATGGSIIAMGSLNSHRAHARQCLYTATKHAVLGIVRATALDLGRYGIRVNALAPGPIATEALVERVHTRAKDGGPPVEEALGRHACETALGRLATEEDVAKAALFLAGDQSSGMTGQMFPVDAGLA
jgi:NAD(P)-dependent dehydrogenase (short-subunit alcohol dehydrogenase family)